VNDALRSLYDAVLVGERAASQEGTRTALAQGLAAGEILDGALIPAMGEVGRLFEAGEYFVPEMLISAHAMKAALEIIRPLIVDSGLEPVGRVVIGTVRGDMHDIGKNLVAMMLEGAGFEIKDLGVDVSPERFVAGVRDGANLVCLSALLTTTMHNMKVAIQAIESAGVRDQARIIVGGAPVTAEFARHIGADGYAPDASQAARLAKVLVQDAIAKAS